MKKKCRTILPLIVLSLTSCLHVCLVVAGKYTFNLNKEYIASDGFCYERDFDSANQRYTLNFHKDDPRESSVESVGVPIINYKRMSIYYKGDETTLLDYSKGIELEGLRFLHKDRTEFNEEYARSDKDTVYFSFSECSEENRKRFMDSTQILFWFDINKVHFGYGKEREDSCEWVPFWKLM